MGYVTKYGSFWGLIPQTNGRVYWVAPSASYTVEGRTYSASDGNDGLSPERAVLTLDYAIGLCTANVNDVIVLLPGSHSWSASVGVDVAGITITGLPGGKGNPTRQRTSVTVSAADQIFNVTAADVEIAYLHFVAVTAVAAIDASNAADRLYIHDCTVDMVTAAGSTSTIFVQSLGTSGGVRDLRIQNCYVESIGGQGPALDLNDVTNAIVEHCTFALTGSTAWADVIVSATGATGVIIRDCDFQSGTASVMTDVIDWTGNTTDLSLTVLRCYFPVGSDPLEQSATADWQVAQNWLMEVGSLTGGTAVTA